MFQMLFAVVGLTTFGKIVAYFLDHLGEIHNEHFKLLYVINDFECYCCRFVSRRLAEEYASNLCCFEFLQC